MCPLLYVILRGTDTGLQSRIEFDIARAGVSTTLREISFRFAISINKNGGKRAWSSAWL
jgi:hypothetical protein